MERSLFRYVWRHTRPEQFTILLIIILAQIFYFISLNIPKHIVNDAIQGEAFPKDAAGTVVAGSTANFLVLDIPVPGFLSETGWLRLFDGVPLEQGWYLVALSLLFLTMVIINGQFKLNINTMKGRMGERMLRRLRYELFDRVMRFPQGHFRKVKQAEIATMIKDEVEPLGGFIGDAFVQPVFLGGQAATALFFILTQSFWLGMVAVAILLIQVVVIPKLRKRVLVLGKERQLTARQLAGRIAETVDGAADVHANATSNYERADIVARLSRIFFIRFELFKRKFFIKFLNNLLAQTTPFFFYLIGGYLAITGSLDIGGLVAVIAAYKDLPPPVKELIDWDLQRQDVQIKYEQVIEQFTPDGMLEPALQAPIDGDVPPLAGPLVLAGVSVVDETYGRLLDGAAAARPTAARKRSPCCLRAWRGRPPAMRGWANARSTPCLKRSPGRASAMPAPTPTCFPSASARTSSTGSSSASSIRSATTRNRAAGTTGSSPRRAGRAIPRSTSTPTGSTTRPRAPPGPTTSTGAFSICCRSSSSKATSTRSACAAPSTRPAGRASPRAS